MHKLVNTLVILSVVVFTLPVVASEGAHTGRLLHLNETNIQISYEIGGIQSFGIYCEPEICKSLEKYKADTNVLFRLGAWNQSKRGNLLINIRRCNPVDLECSNVRSANQQTERQEEKSYQSRVQALEVCKQKMYKTLETDSRFIKDKDVEYSLVGPDNFWNSFSRMHLNPKTSACPQAFLDNQNAAVIEACELHECGDPDHLMCWEMVWEIPNNEMMTQAIEQCK